jgi:hypothetical protein
MAMATMAMARKQKITVFGSWNELELKQKSGCCCFEQAAAVVCDPTGALCISKLAECLLICLADLAGDRDLAADPTRNYIATKFV